MALIDYKYNYYAFLYHMNFNDYCASEYRYTIRFHIDFLKNN